MTEEEVRQKTTEELLREEVMNDLDTAVSEFQESRIGGVELQQRALQAWDKALTNEDLSFAINSRLQLLRVVMNQLAKLDISYGDPVRKRYDPNLWIESVPLEFMGKEEEYIIDKINSLRIFFFGLSL